MNNYKSVKKLNYKELTSEFRVLKYLLEHKSITSLEAIKELSNTRLSASIYILKNSCDEKIDSFKNTSLNKFGEKTSYSVYYLKKDEKEVFKKYGRK